MQRRHLIVACLSLMLASVVVAAQATARPTPTTTAAQPKKEIVIGVAVALSGFATAFDGPSLNGFKLAIKQFNAKNGILGQKVRLVFADTKSDIAQGAKAGEEVVAKGAQFMIVSCDYDFGGGAARVANKRKMVVLSLCAASPLFGVQGIGPYAFSTGTLTNVVGAVNAEFAYFNKKWRNAYILKDTSIEYSKSVCDTFKQRFEELGGRIVGEDTVQNGDASIAAQITRIRQTQDVDFVRVCSYLPGGATFILQLRERGVTLPILADDSMDGSFWYSKTLPRLSDVFFPSPTSIFGNDPNPAVNAAVKAYTREYKAPPATSIALFGMAPAQALKIAVERAKSLRGDAVKAQLEKFENVPLITGPQTFTKTLHIDKQRRMLELEVRNGKHVVVARIKPRKVPPVKF
jgi:branched-chain amino acid transport system substrate-binding protein